MDAKPVAELRRLVGFPDRHWRVLCEPMLKASAPDTLETFRRILMIRHGVYLPVGAPAEDIYRLRDLWTYAVMVTVLINKGMSMNDIPDVGRQWLESDEECMRNLAMVKNGAQAGILYELLQRADASRPENTKGFKGHPSAPDERERENPVKVQSELFSNSDSIDEPAVRKEEVSRPGEIFLHWLREGIHSGEIKVNKPKARVHVVEEGVLIVSPVTFRDFDPDHWDDVQRDLLSMGIHKPGYSNNLSTYTVQGNPGVKTGIKIQGILIPDTSLLFDSSPDANPVLELC